MAHRVVNSLAAFAIAGLAACSRPVQPAPHLPPDAAIVEAGSAHGVIPDSVGIAWRFDAGEAVTQPAVSAGNVTVLVSGRSVTALDTRTGTRFWARSLGGPVIGAPARDAERVYVATRTRDERVHALDAARGRDIWSQRLGDVRTAAAIAGRHLLIGNGRGELIALDVATGGVQWRAPFAGAAVGTPFVHGAHAMITTERDTLYRVTLESGEIDARVSLGATVSAPATLDEHRLVLALHSREIVAYGLPELVELWRTAVDDVVLARPFIDEGDVVVATRSSTVWRVAHDGTASRMAHPGGSITSAFLVAGGRYVLGRLDGSLLCLERDGREVWRVDLGSSIVAGITASGGALLVGLLDGGLVQIR